ncbi:coiled-coil-helix-coiled-coil-helix domain-containing protein 2-like [Argonauta hians]
MPRRGRSMSSRPMAPAPAPRPAPPAPVHPPPSAVAAPPQQPGLFKQMAATAAGVAVGSAVGHTVGHAITGSFSGSNNEVSAPAQQAAPLQPMESPLERSTQGSKLCEWEIKQFMDCAQNQNDISLCSGFNEAIKLCKQQNGISL